ncbi:MAG TPA: DUF3341 domain-containing protein, partial [Blastocatellia bacterium]|nr:DUF3341 domain-containing protein [Blastocatellia bacterium]
EGYTRIDAYSPFPVEGLTDALGFRKTRVPLIVLIGGLIGCAVGYSMQYWIAGVYFPINIGGRPLNSWPSFIPITFELTVLFSAVFAVFGMLALNGLPTPYHPLFNVPRFALASRDRFFLAIMATDKKFKMEETKEFMQRLGAREVSNVDY